MSSNCMAVDDPALTKAPKYRALTLSHLDGRTVAARNARSKISELEQRLGGAAVLDGVVGGRELVRDFAFLAAFTEDLASRMIAGQKFNADSWTAAIALKRRLRFDLDNLCKTSKQNLPPPPHDPHAREREAAGVANIKAAIEDIADSFFAEEEAAAEAAAEAEQEGAK